MSEHVLANLSPDTRRQQTLELLGREGERSVDQLAERFYVSAMTIRRDLQELSEQGEIHRTRGGAALSGAVAFEFQFLERAREAATEKRMIAQAAAKLIQPGQKVLLDSSTTTLAIAQRLKSMHDLTVITTSLPIASVLFGRDNVEVILLGGSLRKQTPDLTGALTEQGLELLRADVALLGADAVDETGHACTSQMEVARVLQRMAQAAERGYAVADHRKLGRRALLRFADLRQWAGLITDPGADAACVEHLREAGVGVIVAEGEEDQAGGMR